MSGFSWGDVFSSCSCPKKFDYISKITISPDGNQFAYYGIARGKVYYIINGTISQPYDNITEIYIRFSPDSRRIVYNAYKNCKEIGRGIICNGFVTENGRRHKSYAEVGTPIFSQDGSRLAYGATIYYPENDTFGAKNIVDEVESETYQSVNSVMFSQDSKHYAYAVLKPDGVYMVIDGKEHGTYRVIAGNYSFMEDNQTFVYSVTS